MEKCEMCGREGGGHWAHCGTKREPLPVRSESSGSVQVADITKFLDEKTIPLDLGDFGIIRTIGSGGIMDTNMKSKTKDTLCITFQTYWPFVEISRKEQLDLARQPKLRIGYATRTMSKRLRTFG